MKKLTLTILSVLMCCHALVAQQNQLTGKVVAETGGEALAGVMVLVKGGNAATVTDASGAFSLNVPSFPATMEFSIVGMETKEVTVADAVTGLEVRLEESSTLIDDVVVVGYGTVRKSDLTGAVSSLKSEQVTESRMLSLDQAIAGKVAGVNIVNTSGEPGGGLTINIRGVGSINADTEPLYVIDGAPMYRDAGLGVGGIDGLTGGTLNPMSGINPQDIESIEILKDASATAIYGSRGANGVVLITTKSGKKGEARINFSSYAGFSYVSKKIDVLNGYDFIDAHVNDFKTPDYVTNQDTYLAGPMHNWQDEILKIAPKQEHVLSVNGGTDRTSYSMSASYTDQKGVVDKSDYKRFTARARIDQSIGNRMKAGINMMYSKFDQVGTASEGSKDNGADVFQQMLSYRPANVRFNDSDLDESGELAGDFNAQTNPVDYIRYSQMNTANSRLMLNSYLQYNLAKGIIVKSSYNYGMTNTKGSTFFPRSLAAGNQQNGRARKGFAERDNWSWENIVTFDRNLGKDHKINAVAGFTMERQGAYNYSQSAENFPDSYAGLPEINLGSALTITAPVETANSSTMVSYLARVNYTLKNRYLFTASFRADGSSKFPAGKRYGYFPSAAFAWKVIEEPFMRNAKQISDLKLRLSYGQTGNQSVAPYSSQALYGAAYYSFNTGAGLGPSSTLQSGVATTSIANPFLTWETTEQWNAGVDIGLFKNRLSLSVDAYMRNTYDLLLSRPVLLHTGYSNMMSNSGSLTNRGIEFSLNSVNIDKPSFSWSSTLNLSFNRNRVENLGENAVLRFSSHTDFQENFVLAAGQPVGTMYGYQVDGVYSYADYKNFYVDGAAIRPRECCPSRNGTRSTTIYGSTRTGPRSLWTVRPPCSMRFRK